MPEDDPACVGMEGASRAYNRAARRGLVRPTECEWAPLRPRDGSCIAHFL